MLDHKNKNRILSGLYRRCSEHVRYVLAIANSHFLGTSVFHLLEGYFPEVLSPPDSVCQSPQIIGLYIN